VSEQQQQPTVDEYPISSPEIDKLAPAMCKAQNEIKRARKDSENPFLKSQYADLKQLEILALALFKHYPQVKRVKAGLLFLFADDFIKTVYSADAQSTLWTDWVSDVGQLETSVINDVWNAKPNFTCRGWCPVHSCDHNQGAK